MVVDGAVVLSWLIAGLIGACIGYLLGNRASSRPAEPLPKVTETPRTRAAERARQAYDPPPAPAGAGPGDDPGEQGRPQARPGAAAPARKPVKRLPIVDDRPNEDRTVFRKLSGAVDAFRQSQSVLDQMDGKDKPAGGGGGRAPANKGAAAAKKPPKR